MPSVAVRLKNGVFVPDSLPAGFREGESYVVSPSVRPEEIVDPVERIHARMRESGIYEEFAKPTHDVVIDRGDIWDRADREAELSPDDEPDIVERIRSAMREGGHLPIPVPDEWKSPSERLLATLREDGFAPFRVGDGYDPVFDRGEIWDRDTP